MGKLAILKSVSFGHKDTFDEISDDKITIYLQDKVVYKEFTNTLELYSILQEIFRHGADIEIVNCHYDEIYLTQALCVNNDNDELHTSTVIVKRLIHDEDTYTFLEFDTNNPDSDVYTYSDVSNNDIMDIIRRKTVIPVVCINTDGKIMNDEIIILVNKEDVGKIVVKNMNRELSYVNISSITNINHNKCKEELEQILKEKI